MLRKRKTEAAVPLDEVDRTLYTSFSGAANSLSQLYSQAMNHQKLSFQAGEHHAMEKLYQWILRQHEEGSRLTVADIVHQIQSEMDYTGEDASVSPRVPSQSQHPQIAVQFSNSSSQASPVVFGQAIVGFGPRGSNSDQAKNSVFSNALSSPVRRGLQPYHLAQGGRHYSNSILPAAVNSGDRSQDHHQNREGNSHSTNYSSMDMHSDSPPHESY